jgi:glycosyltransferase involved in cell wall biosynthesis
MTVRVAFIMARASSAPIGALKTVYSYASRLGERGHDILLVHPRRPVRHPLGPPTRAVVPIMPPDAHPHPWFSAGPRTRSVLVSDPADFLHTLSGRHDPFDVVLATTWQVVPLVAALPAYLGLKALFLQDYESYLRPDGAAREAMESAMRTGWPIAVGARRLRSIVESVSGAPCALVECAVDSSTFFLRTPIDSAERVLVGFPARREWSKRTGDAITALELAREARPGVVRAWCFGAYDADRLPFWIEHHPGPSDARLRGLYNRSAVFAVPSEYEGFGFPGAEAMACGAALVSTRNHGMDSYAEHDRTALLCPPRDPDALAEGIVRLLDDAALRHRLARTAVKEVVQRTMDDAVSDFETWLLTIREASPR